MRARRLHRVRWARVIVLGMLVYAPGCEGDPPPSPRATPTVERAPRAKASAPPASDVADDQLAALYHLQWIRGELGTVKRGLRTIVDNLDASAQTRARAALRLAEIAENSGSRRQALGLLVNVSEIVGANHELARRADDLRERFRSATPLADVRGPIPGTVTLAGESAQINAVFRRAEQHLARFHRVIVAPRLENIDAVLRQKRRALRLAVKRYDALADRGQGAAKAAAYFRIGAMYHHFAEAVAFDRPPELTPTAAERLARRLRSESVNHLRRALDHYRKALRTAAGPGVARWRRLARAESQKLARELAAPRR